MSKIGKRKESNKMKKILIKNGNVIFENRIERADILVENDKIIKIGSIEEECESIDAKG